MTSLPFIVGLLDMNGFFVIKEFSKTDQKTYQACSKNMKNEEANSIVVFLKNDKKCPSHYVRNFKEV